jgi:ribonuclease HI
MTALHRFTNHVESALYYGEYALACFLDIEGAFDKASFDSFKRAAQFFGICPLLTQWILTMLRQRKLTAELRGCMVSMNPVKGCPQGGVLSPLIWILIADSLLRDLNAAKFFAVGYADDFSLVVRGKFLDAVYSRMSAALDIVNKFTNYTGLSVNPLKVGLVLFTRKRKFTAPCLTFNGSELKLSPTWKMLGLEFDSKLNWGPHLESRINKSCKIFGQCRRVIGRNWGLSPKSSLWLYEMVILPVLTYGAVVWWEKAQQATVMAKLNHLQRMALLSVSGAMSTTPTAALEIILGVHPLHLRIEAVARAELYRLRCWNQLVVGGVSSGHVKLWNKMVAENPQWSAPADYMIPVTLPHHNFRVLIPDRDEWEEGYLMQLGADTIIFTDGSLCDGLAGAGVYSPALGLNLAYNLGPAISVFQSEIFAISAGASECLRLRICDAKIAFCVDSQAALLSLESNVFKSRAVLECFSLLSELSHNNEVILLWVPGHSGVPGNEMVDELARVGSSEPATAAFPFLPLPRSWASCAIREWLFAKNTSRWRNLQSCQQTKCFIQKPLDRSQVSGIRNLPRDQLRLLCGGLTGHYYFRRHLQNMGLSDSSLCPRCEADQDTAFHILCNCPRLTSKRNLILGRHILSEEEARQLKLDDILRFLAEVEFV